MVGVPRPNPSKARAKPPLVSTFANDRTALRREHARQIAFALAAGLRVGKLQAPRGFGLRFAPNAPEMAPTAPRWWHLSEATKPERRSDYQFQGERLALARVRRIRKGSRLRFAQIRGGIA